MTELPKYPPPTAPVASPAVARSLGKPDAFMKPGAVARSSGRGSPSTRIRLTNEKKIGRPRKKKRDPRNVVFF